MLYASPGQNRLQRRLPFSIQLRRIDALKNGQIPRHLLQSFPQLQFRATLVSPLMMIETHRKVNHRLQEEPFHALSGPP